MQAKITHALPDVRDLRTSGNGCYQSPSFLRPRDQNGGSGDENGAGQEDRSAGNENDVEHEA